MKLNAELIRRYDGHGPRYTSYPTAVHFHTGFDEQSYRRAALRPLRIPPLGKLPRHRTERRRRGHML